MKNPVSKINISNKCSTVILIFSVYFKLNKHVPHPLNKPPQYIPPLKSDSSPYPKYILKMSPLPYSTQTHVVH